jgi:hypothetical protein
MAYIIQAAGDKSLFFTCKLLSPLFYIAGYYRKNVMRHLLLGQDSAEELSMLPFITELGIM